MRPALIVSPHLDDAVLSCGQFLAGRPDVTVCTVFAGEPLSGKTEYDRRCGFTTSSEAVVARRHEDRLALDTVKGRWVHLPFFDHQYEVEPRKHEVVTALANVIGDVGPELVMFPLGLEHPDHRLVSDLVASAVGTGRWLGTRCPMWVYEELPARVLWPDQVSRRLDDVRRLSGRELSLEFPGDGPRDRKVRAIRCYKSQLWALDWPTLLVPERYWLLHSP